ncbi:PREDICTED: paired amphipathic helix protein Sin3-like 5 isoform X2 [Tarenaya hassleriana]|uniref:paired amphipathic helix protein Sin3-like 5 isoform X2 n=1 Tax=Tarenaya hassleriana TaxID=28532 RepID=UPI00053C8045|nr:PREDICTED: paired amphipathic helix protein Sin3-like 5 isoform X2 [Tarenaya hassleriana]
MKRGRDEVYMAAKIPRPAVSSRGETNGQPQTMGGAGGNMGKLTTSDALSYLKAVKDKFHDKKEKYDTFLEVMKDFKAQRIDTHGVIARVKDLFKGYQELLLGFNTFLPKGYEITLPLDDERRKKPADFGEAINFVTKIKARFQDDDRSYKSFLDILNLYRKESKSISEVYQEVTILFQDHEDLLEEFAHFLPDSSGSTSTLFSLSGRNAAPRDQSSAMPTMHQNHYDKKIRPLHKVEDYSEHSDQGEAGDENIVACSGNSLAKSHVNEGQWSRTLKADDNGGIQDYENNGHQERGLDNGHQETERSAASGSKDIGSHKIPISTSKHVAKPINELDLSDCAQCTPSYRLLPDTYPVQIPSHRNEIGDEVLNDRWVSVTSGSEDYSFKHMRKNQYEESLFRCEDDRFELDMLLESVNAAIKRVEALILKINDNTISTETPICIREHLTALNLRCIERLYGDYGLDVMDFLKKNAHVALPVILTRLKQKQEEWARCRFDFRKVWADVYAKNHHKSLDHRSFYFKQQDSKNLSTKGLVAEIKDINEKKYKDDLLHTFTAATKSSLTPDLEFSYSDPQIHEDLYQLINYYCEEICASEQSDKVMKIWITFLEPMFGIPSRPRVNDSVTAAVESKEQNLESHDPCARLKEGNLHESSSAKYSKHSTSPRESNKESLTLKQGYLDRDVMAPIGEVTQQDKVQSDAVMTNEDGQSSNPVSSRDDPITEGLKNHRLNEAPAREHKVEREEGELSPADSFERDSFEVYGESSLEPMQKVIDYAQCNKYHQRFEVGSDENNGITHKSSEDNKNATKLVGEDSSPEEHIVGMNRDEHDNVCESENEAVEGTNSHDGEDDPPCKFSDRFLRPVKPLAKHVSTELQDSESNSRSDSQLFYANDSFYVLFRLHQMLYERIQSAKVHSEKKWKAPDNTTPSDAYSRFMDALYSLLDGSSDNTKFEDECRTIIGSQSYVLFTLDKLVQKFVKHLHAVATDETDTKLLQLYTYENYRMPGRFFDVVYHENARTILHDQNIYRIENSSRQNCLSIQLMNGGHDRPEVTAVTLEPGFAHYLQNDLLSLVSEEEKSGLFLKRNKQKLIGKGGSSGISLAMEGVKIINEMECRITCSSSKIRYVPDTEDLIYRGKRRKPNPDGTCLKEMKTSSNSEITRLRRIAHFHILLNCRMLALP